MFLPRSKYQIKQASWGQFILSGSQTGRFYVGPYIEDYLGRTYAGDTLEGAEDRVLVPAQGGETQTRKTISLDILPKKENYKVGSYIRYFRQNKTTRVVEEVDSQVQKKSDKQLWNFASCIWRVSGKLDDQLIHGYTWRGLRYWNGEALKKLEREIPGIVEALELKPEDFVEEN